MVAFTDNAWDIRGQDGQDRSHIPSQPLWAVFVRIAEIVLAFIVLVLTAYAASQLTANVSSFGMTWYTFIWTIFYIIYLSLSLLFVPRLYNVWIQLAVESLSTLWWLVSWALLARDASEIASAERYIGGLPSGVRLSPNVKSAADCVKASAALGALIWVLFAVNLIFFALSLLKHNKAAASQNPPAQSMANVDPSQQQPGYPGQHPPPEGYPQGQYPPQAYQQYPVDPQQQQYGAPPQQDYAAQQQQQAFPPQQYPPQSGSPYQHQSPYTQPQQPPYPQQPAAGYPQ